MAQKADKKSEKEQETELENKEGNETEEETETKESESKETKTLTDKEIKELVGAARKQEKDKLYDTIEELKDTVKTLKSQAETEKEEKERIKKEAEKKAEEERLSKLSNSEKIEELEKKFEEKLSQEKQAREKLEAEARAERELRELEEYRSQLIAEAEGKLIPELVRGTSRDEIDRNVAVAKDRFQELFQEAKSELEGKKQDIGNRLPGSTDPDPASLEEEVELGAYKPGMSQEEYQKHRDEILDSVSRAYQRNVGAG